MVSEQDLIYIVAVVLLAVALAGIGLFALRRFRARRDRLRSEIDASRASVEERAFNRIHIGKSAADHLERSGADVAGPRRLLAQASKEYDAGHHDDALALASSAHEALLKQAKGPTPAAAPVGPDPPIPRATPPAASSPPPPISRPMSPSPAAESSSPEASDPPKNRLPKNKAESHFQLRLLDEELAAGGPAGTSKGTIAGVGGIATEAHSSYDRGDFTEALRLALKGRRTLGARLETLPPSSATQAVDAATAPSPAPAGTELCRQCGQPLRSGDKFCRGCGAAAVAPRCARCGDALEPKDQFCGRCGTPRPQ